MKKIKILLVMVFFMIIVLHGQIIVNSDKPAKGKWDLQLKKVWEIGGTGTKDFGRIQNVRVSMDGRVLVLDNKLKKILIFSKGGKFLSEFGEMGEGPGEFKNFRMGDQLFILKNTIIVIDRGRVHYFSFDGKFIKTVKTPDSIKPRGFISKDLLISAPVMVMDSGQKVEEIKSYNVITKTESVISTFKPFDKASASGGNRGNRIRIGIVIGGITPLMNIAYKDGNIFYGMSDNYKITKRDLKKKKEITFVLKGREQKNISKKFLNAFSKRLKQIPPEMKKKIIDGLPKKASFFQRISILDNGLVYIFISDPDNDSAQAIDIFSKDGKYLYSANIDIGEDNDLGNIEFSGDSIILSFQDEEGEIKLAKYKIVHPKL